MNNINPTKTKAWQELKKHFKIIKKMHLIDLFKNDPKRFKNFSICINNKMLVDYSKNFITQETMNILKKLAIEVNLEKSIQKMFAGEKINETENRPVLHTALRNNNNKSIIVDGEDIMKKVKENLKKMDCFSKKIINGTWVGYTNKKITDVVNIGIGGSDLGPLMVTESLRPYKNHINMHFVSNIDGTHILETLKKLNPETVLFLITSKTFTTLETMTNAESAKSWFLKYAKEKKYILQHFIGISTNIKEAIKFGINKENIFEFWDWVGGRYSLWSSIGLSISLSIGFKNFKRLLNGAYHIDQHFLTSPIEKNIPVILGLIGIWYNNFFKAETEAILPYDQYMHRFPAYCQQSFMESNGKNVDRNGNSVNYQTGHIIWGEPGTNGQHSFYQLLHQGTKMVPCDFIAPVKTHNPLSDHHTKLISNFFAQTEALAFGSSLNITEEKEYVQKQKENLYKKFPGNQPTNSILIKKINPFNLGMLIAIYEHKIFTQGIILNIFSFDQWGVELGKKLANIILPELKNNLMINFHDSSTNGLINQYKNWLKD
ncbi:glucose-6-phosphate isomerase [Candidatus Tachikawaea gelatinosa]|uniref:Glucose-6-phosphate isomerase n=1 Tax=Candidatus Tachikawaea gelatinosa TaxID=1410383 RepID=A0A090AK83_9ENTR|nr:glucose-6-phosphate isomerase [Candidatus Tachikawaea gelatinosa]BAP58843.1 glucose-6-phosphate isomerase [Candidatus Tachikawaea gelatinosa]